MINNSLPMAGYNEVKDKVQTRKEKIAFCVWATAEINGVDVSKIEWELFENSTDEQLERECEWLDDLLSK